MELEPEKAERSISAALQTVGDKYCTEVARNVLHQELIQLRLCHVMKEKSLDRADALLCMRTYIDKLNANGPSVYHTDRCRIDVLRSCLRGETWFALPWLQVETDPTTAKATSLAFVSLLISYLRAKTSVDSKATTANPATLNIMRAAENLPLEDDIFDGFFAEARARPFVSRGRSYRHSYPPRDTSSTRFSLQGFSGKYSGRGERGGFQGRGGSQGRETLHATLQQQNKDLSMLLPQGACLYCRQPGHRIIIVPKRSAGRPPLLFATNLQKALLSRIVILCYCPKCTPTLALVRVSLLQLRS